MLIRAVWGYMMVYHLSFKGRIVELFGWEEGGIDRRGGRRTMGGIGVTLLKLTISRIPVDGPGISMVNAGLEAEVIAALMQPWVSWYQRCLHISIESPPPLAKLNPPVCCGCCCRPKPA